MATTTTKQQLIKLLASTLRKDSKWYADDYATIVRNVGKMTSKQVAESFNRQRAIGAVSAKEININCQC